MYISLIMIYYLKQIFGTITKLSNISKLIYKMDFIILNIMMLYFIRI